MTKQNERYEHNLTLLYDRSFDEEAELVRVERQAIANFSGQLEDLEAALGMLRIGHHFGWRVLVLIHNKRTLRKYEKILNIEIRSFFRDEGPSHERSLGYMATKKITNFWKAVSGAIKIPNRRSIDESVDEGA